MRVLSAFVATCLSASTLFAASAKSTVTTVPELMYIGVWPHTIAVVDAKQEKIVDKIELPTDIARSILLTPDKKKLVVSTLRDNSILIVDPSTKKIEKQFSLNDGGKSLRLSGLAVAPDGKSLYSVGTEIEKKIDHYEVGEPKLVVIDIDQKKVVRSVDFGRDNGNAFRTSMRVSPDGKLLYIFRQTIDVYDTATLKLVKKIDLAKSDAPETVGLSLNPVEDPNEKPGKLVGIFRSSDPYVHRSILGVAEIDMQTLSYDLTPVAPTETSMQGLLMSPDHKLGYTVAVNGTHGNRVTEFWVFDLNTKKILDKKEFAGRTRLAQIGLTADGSKLMVYSAGYQIEFYDAKTLTLRSSLDLQGDATSNLIVMPIAGK